MVGLVRKARSRTHLLSSGVWASLSRRFDFSNRFPSPGVRGRLGRDQEARRRRFNSLSMSLFRPVLLFKMLHDL